MSGPGASSLCLEGRNLQSGYGQMQVLWGIDIEVRQKEAVLLLGANGAGKSTLLRALFGLLPLTDGEISLFGKRIERMSPAQRAQEGISYMSETGVLAGLSIEENLLLGGYGMGKEALKRNLARTWERFPALQQRRKEMAGSLSGGQRKILGVARALMRDPKLILMDEPSSGLSPRFVGELVETLAAVRAEQGVTLLLAEQNIRFLEIADRAYVIEGGRVRFEGSVEDFEKGTDVREAFFGVSAQEA